MLQVRFLGCRGVSGCLGARLVVSTALCQRQIGQKRPQKRPAPAGRLPLQGGDFGPRRVLAQFFAPTEWKKLESGRTAAETGSPGGNRHETKRASLGCVDPARNQRRRTLSRKVTVASSWCPISVFFHFFAKTISEKNAEWGAVGGLLCLLSLVPPNCGGVMLFRFGSLSLGPEN